MRMVLKRVPRKFNSELLATQGAEKEHPDIPSMVKTEQSTVTDDEKKSKAKKEIDSEGQWPMMFLTQLTIPKS